jgi:hypothetical protein
MESKGSTSQPRDRPLPLTAILARFAKRISRKVKVDPDGFVQEYLWRNPEATFPQALEYWKAVLAHAVRDSRRWEYFWAGPFRIDDVTQQEIDRLNTAYHHWVVIINRRRQGMGRCSQCAQEQPRLRGACGRCGLVFCRSCVESFPTVSTRLFGRAVSHKQFCPRCQEELWNACAICGVAAGGSTECRQCHLTFCGFCHDNVLARRRQRGIFLTESVAVCSACSSPVTVYASG